jgi:hypothetical protein
MLHRCAVRVGIFSLGLLLGACGSTSPGSNDGGGGASGGGGRGDASGGASVDAAAGHGSAGASGSGGGGARGSDAASDAGACPQDEPKVQLVDGGFVEPSCTSAGQACDYRAAFCTCGPEPQPLRSEAGGLVWNCSPII